MERREKEGGGDWQECSSGSTLQVCTSSMLWASKTTIRHTLAIKILISFMVVSASCIPAVCMLVIGRGTSVFAVVDVQSFCVVRSWGILNRSGPLPLGKELIIWEIKVITCLKLIQNAVSGGGGSKHMHTEHGYAWALTIIQSEAVR